MSEGQSMEEVEKELWDRVAQNEGLIRADSYIALARIAYDKRNFEESIALCEVAREYFENNEESEHLHEILDINIGISKNYEELKKPSEAALALNNAIVVARILELDTLDDLLREQGQSWYSAGEYEKSLQCLHEAMEISAAHLMDVSAGMDYLNLGICFRELRRFPEAIKFLLRARENFKTKQDVIWLVTVDCELAEVYVALENPVEIFHYGQRALDFHTLLQNSKHIWTLKYYLGVAQRLIGQNDEAIILFEEAKEICLMMGDQEWKFLIKIEREIGQILIAQGKTTEAKEIFRRIKNIEQIVEIEAVNV